MIPLFPLTSALFPGAALPLRVFEERYLAMMADVLAADRAFAVAAISSGREVGGRAEVFEVCCIGSVERVTRSGDGSMAIVVRGTSRARIESRAPDDPYPRAVVTPLAEVEGTGASEAVASARAALNRYLGALARARRLDIEAPAVSADPIAASFAVAASLDATAAEQQELLECSTAADRLRLAAAIARREAAILDAVGPRAATMPVRFSSN